MKAYVIKQWEELCAIDESSELYRIFFRVLQVICLVAGLFQLIMFVPMGFSLAYGADFNAAFLVLPLAFTLLQVFLAAFAQRRIQAGKFHGTMIGLAISLLCVPSWYLPLGVFGLYCFLNPAYQRKYLANAPQPFVDFLQLLHIDYTKSAAAADVPATATLVRADASPAPTSNS